MPITGARFDAYRLPFVTPWRSKAGTWQFREGWLIQLTDDQGNSGYGDAAPLPEIGTETLRESAQRLNALLPTLIGWKTEQAFNLLTDAVATPASRFGLETALLDLQSKQRAIPLYRLLTDQEPKAVQINASIGSLEHKIIERAVSAITAGYSTLKLKLGLNPIAQELSQLQHLCAQLPEHCTLRLDANRAWKTDEATQLISGLDVLPIESLEEPLKNSDPEMLRELQKLVPFDLALDESLSTFLLQHSLNELPVSRIIIKPTLLGGLLPSLELIQKAHRTGIRCVITSSLESSAGIWPLLHLAAAADAHTESVVHGLATANLFKSDLGRAPAISNGQVQLDDRPGSGFILSR
ncbi:MAG: o-succinylbenzoate synthase [Sedimenticola sp.]|nr:o-succinylbenzoate synthase [Sedimenticola sp.]